ncbi:tetratricopeptide repeat protein [Novosphingobium sp.]|uniref:tetratricopeptide repeat protein n=1 Tax=Novosphingobium sp. TaxID=1874826 RepID=UPI001D5CE5A4|nr:tetratricopeptide repeat protein [Novosphingobium sp.]MBX9663280.1 tetratricopeptide repeat protein [Novosphingobium sp.]
MKALKPLAIVLAAVLGTGAIAAWAWQAPAEAEPAAPAQARFVSPYEPTALTVEQGLARVRSAPSDATAWRDLGNAQLKARKFRDAEQSYVKALAIAPDHAETWSALGEARIQFQNADGARMPSGAAEAFRRTLALAPRDPRARFYFAMEKDFIGQHDAAIGEWLELLREVPAGSDADNAVRTAIAASVNRNQKLIARALERASQAQPRSTGS